MRQRVFMRKLAHAGNPLLNYHLADIDLNERVGSEVSLQFTGRIECIFCSRTIRKTFNQGYCYPCFQGLARCDACIIKPHLCHHAAGTCREPEWAEDHCLIPHVVYLAVTSGLKVGVTRGNQCRTRWGDQGASAAIVLAETPDRLTAGLIEALLSRDLSDRTDWRALLRGETPELDLLRERDDLLDFFPEDFEEFVAEKVEVHRFEYPVLQYPVKAKTHNLEKEPLLRGRLDGIRGQYLLIDGKGLNARKYAGYEIEIDFN